MSSKNKQFDAYDPTIDQNYQTALKALKVLEEAGYDARMAGGCVRDRLLGVRPKDYDIATNAKPDQISLIFKQKNIKTVPTGIEHGTITVVISGQPIEITSLRRDVATDGRRAVVAFGESFEEDSLRRDFTINALYEDRHGEVFDFHFGKDDLKNETLRFVGVAEERIREDYLRILRLFRFWARLDFAPAPGTLEAITQEVRGLERISSERITSELLLTFECEGFPKVLPALYKTGTLGTTLGLQEDARLLKLDWTALYLHNKADTALARLAALLWYLPDLTQKTDVLERLRLSRAQKDKILSLFSEALPSDPSDPGEVFEWLDKIEARHKEYTWKDLLLPVWSVLRPDPGLKRVDQTIEKHRLLRECPIKGQFLIERLGLEPGPKLGEWMADLKRAYRRGQWTTEDEALALVKTWQK